MAGAADLRQLRRRIKSVQSTKKITRAMELIAASRIAKARRAVQASRPYSDGLEKVVRNLSSFSGAKQHRVMREPSARGTTCVIVITSDRGLAGAYNSNVLKRAFELITDLQKSGEKVQLVTIGAKGESWLKFRHYHANRSFIGVSDKPTPKDARRICDGVVKDYVEGRIGRVMVVYTDFVNALTQVPRYTQILPIRLDEDDAIGKVYDSDSNIQIEKNTPSAEYIIEPDLNTMFDALLPRYIQQKLFAALLESSASEHASRQRAMKAATENAEDVIDTLTIRANTARQAAVTSEISEIVGGADALANSH